MMISVRIRMTTITGDATGGGGGCGCGGATRNVINCVLGKASVNSSGSNTRTPISATCNTNEKTVVAPRFVLSLPPDSIRLSSNIRLLLHRPYVRLDTALDPFAPNSG